MAITHVGNGGGVSGAIGSTTLTPPLPSGLVDRDLVCLAWNAANVLDPIASAEWGAALYYKLGTGGGVKIACWTLPYQSAAPPSTTLTYTSQAAGALCFAYRPTAGYGTPTPDVWDDIGTNTTTTVTWPSVIPAAVEEMCVFLFNHTNITVTMGAISGVDPVPTERYDAERLGYADGIKLSVTATGQRTATSSVSDSVAGVVILLREGPLLSVLPTQRLAPQQRYR